MSDSIILTDMNVERGKANAIMETHRRLNGSNRRVPKLPKAIRDASEDTKVFIFNVGPWSHTQFMGSLGQYHIQACPEGKEYSESLAIPGVVTELYPMGDKYDMLIDENSDGYTLAQAILGVGKHMAPSNSLVRYGVGIARSWPPTEDDIKAANEALYAHFAELVEEANRAAAEGPGQANNTIRADQHILAARRLHKTKAECPWMERSAEVGAERISCPFCGVSMGSSLPKCPNCKEVVNQAAYKAVQARARGQEG